VNIWNSAGYSIFLLLGTICSIGMVRAGVPLTDSPDGMTCYDYVNAYRLPWLQKGGDWLDAGGQIHGDVPYASAPLVVKQGRQQVRIDVTPLAQAWSKSSEPVGGLLLRMVPGTRSGLVDINSRESPDLSAHPILYVEWNDGQINSVRPAADTYLPCSTVASVGNRPYFQIGDGMSAILSFPLDVRPGVIVKSALLVLTTDKQYGGNTSKIGVYQPLLPWAQPTSLERGLASDFVLDRNIEADPSVIFVERFESWRWRSAWSDYDESGDAETVEERSDGGEPLDGKALKVTIRKGKTQGLNMHYRFAQSGGLEPEEVYFRYYLRFGESWDPVIEGGKLPGLAGTYGRAGWGGRKPDGRNGWSARGSFFTMPRQASPLSNFRGVGSYLYEVGMASAYGEILGWGLGPSGALEKNRWYSIEQQVRMNHPGKKDGVLRAWVDGKLVFEKTDVLYRTVLDLRIESVWMNVYHGGTQPAHKDMSLFIDNIVVARKYIGPMAGNHR